jgi:maltose O-acetyltransferase
MTMESQRYLARLMRAIAKDVDPMLSRKLLAELAAHLPSTAFAATRTAVFRAAGAKIGKHSLIQGGMRITGTGNPCTFLSIGDNTLVTGGLHLDLGAPVRIGDMVRIGHDVSILTITHSIGPWYLRSGDRCAAEVVIENGCWLASRCTILPGVVVGAGAIVAAGAVVTRNVPANTLVAGVPARVLRELPEGAERTERLSDSMIPD